MAFLGVGGVGAVLLLPRIAGDVPQSRIVAAGMIVLAAAAAALGATSSYWLACLIILAAGAAWLTLFTGFQVAAVSLLPDWVRARALSVYLTALFGALAAGALIWGTVATHLGVTTAFYVVAGTALILVAATWRLPVPKGRLAELKLDAATTFPMHEPSETPELDEGPVMVTMRYTVETEDEDEFLYLVERLGVTRRRRGAVYWAVYRDLERPGDYLELFATETWADLLRMRARRSAADLELRRLVAGFHAGHTGPEINDYLVVSGGH
jgi:MFS family permease